MDLLALALLQLALITGTPTANQSSTDDIPAPIEVAPAPPVTIGDDAWGND